jgi:hypothetical protein
MIFGGFYPAVMQGYLQMVIEVDRFEGHDRVWRRRGSRLRGFFRARVLPFAEVVKEVGIGSVLKAKESNFGSDGTFDGEFEIFRSLKIVELINGDGRAINEEFPFEPPFVGVFDIRVIRVGSIFRFTKYIAKSFTDGSESSEMLAFVGVEVKVDSSVERSRERFSGSLDKDRTEVRVTESDDRVFSEDLIIFKEGVTTVEDELYNTFDGGSGAGAGVGILGDINTVGFIIIVVDDSEFGLNPIDDSGAFFGSFRDGHVVEKGEVERVATINHFLYVV